MNNNSMSEIREAVIDAALRAADPVRALAQHWSGVTDDMRNVMLVAFGKASIPMAQFATQQLADRLVRGLVVCVAEADPSSIVDQRIQVMVADHPVPSKRNVHAAKALSDFLRRVQANEQLVVLVSGGGSAQICWPRDPLTLEHLRSLTDTLLRSGATINEINCVRKHCEVLKGGQAARIPGGSKTQVFVLSDVLGDPLDVVSSGPFAPDPTTFKEALGVLDRFGLRDVHPEVARVLECGHAGEISETPKPGDQVFASVSHTVIANNEHATNAVAAQLKSMGYKLTEVRTRVQGEAFDLGQQLGTIVRALNPGQAVVWGGEATVTLGQSSGRGGRNQEIALAASIEINQHSGSLVLSLATDGVDGPTDAAGGCVDHGSAQRMRATDVDPIESLCRHDSYHALDACEGLLRIGATGTNVNDVMVGVRMRSL